jgi:hypothetical protein
MWGDAHFLFYNGHTHFNIHNWETRTLQNFKWRDALQYLYGETHASKFNVGRHTRTSKFVMERHTSIFTTGRHTHFGICNGETHFNIQNWETHTLQNL